MKIRRAVIVSGGGANAPVAGGFLAGKIATQGYTWDEFYGTSAGALVATLASRLDARLLEAAFTTLGNTDVWSAYPLNKKCEIKKVNLIKKLIGNKKQLGSTSNLRKTLETIYPQWMFNEVRETKDVVACTTNMTTGKTEYGRNDTEDYATFLDYVWASTCVQVLCEGVQIKGDYHQDGGLLMNVPIQRAIDNGCEEIDVIVLGKKYDPLQEDKWKVKGMVKTAVRSFQLTHSAVTHYGIVVPTLSAKLKGVTLRFRYLETEDVDNPLENMNFDKEKLCRYYKAGYALSLEDNTSTKVMLDIKQ